MLGDLTRLVGDKLRLLRPGIKLSMGDMGLVPRGPRLFTERPITGESEWWPLGDLGETGSIEGSGNKREGSC